MLTYYLYAPLRCSPKPRQNAELAGRAFLKVLAMEERAALSYMHMHLHLQAPIRSSSAPAPISTLSTKTTECSGVVWVGRLAAARLRKCGAAVGLRGSFIGHTYRARPFD